MKRMLNLVAAVAVGVMLASSAQAQTKVRLGLSLSPENAGAYVAKEQGIFAKQGLDVEIVPTPINSNMPPAMIAKAIDVGSLAVTIFLQAVDGGLELQTVTTVSPTTRIGSRIGILAREGIVATNGASVEGKRLGVPAFGGLVHIIARQWVIDTGGDYKKVAFIEAPFPQMPDMLKAGNVDLVATTDPFFARIVDGGIGKSIADLAMTMPEGLPTSVDAVTRDYAAANPAVLKAFRSAIDEAVKSMVADPEAARVALGTHIKLPPEILKIAPLPKAPPPLTLAMLQWRVDAMGKQDMVKNKTIGGGAMAP